MKKTFGVLFLTTCLLLMFAYSALAAGSSFQQPAGGYVAGVFLLPGGEGFAAIGDLDYDEDSYQSNKLYRTEDGGRTWIKIDILVDNVELDDVMVLGMTSIDNTIYMSGVFADDNEHFLSRSKNGGDSFQTIDISGARLLGELGVTGSKLIGADMGVAYPDSIKSLWISEDEGVIWNSIFYKLEGGRKVFDVSGNMIYAAADGGLKISRDGGVTWDKNDYVKTRSQYYPKVVAKGSTVVVNNPDDGMYISVDGGSSWNKTEQNIFNQVCGNVYTSIKGFDMTGDGCIFAVSESGTVLASVDQGVTWKKAGTAGGKGLDVVLSEKDNEITVIIATDKGLKVMACSRADLGKPEEPVPGSAGEEIYFTIAQTGYRKGVLNIPTEAAPFIENGRVYVPVRYLANSLGIEDNNIKWNDSSQTVELTKDGRTVKVVMGSSRLTTGGEVIAMDVAPLIRNGHIYLPARFIATAFDYRVSWDSDNRTVKIFK